MRPAEGGFRVFSLAVVASAASATWRAESSAYHLGFRARYTRGVAAGAATFQRPSAEIDPAAGRAAAASLAITDQATALAAALASTPVSLKRSTKTHTCMPVGGGLCEVLGPGVTGKGCPRASAPSAEGGIVCVPEVLVQAARAAGVPGVNTLTGAP